MDSNTSTINSVVTALARVLYGIIWTTKTYGKYLVLVQVIAIVGFLYLKKNTEKPRELIPLSLFDVLYCPLSWFTSPSASASAPHPIPTPSPVLIFECEGNIIADAFAPVQAEFRSIKEDLIKLQAEKDELKEEEETMRKSLEAIRIEMEEMRSETAELNAEIALYKKLAQESGKEEIK